MIQNLQELCEKSIKTIAVQTKTFELTIKDLSFGGGSYRMIKDAPEYIFIAEETISPTVLKEIKDNAPKNRQFSVFFYKNHQFVFAWNLYMNAIQVFVLEPNANIQTFLSEKKFFQ